MASAELLRVPAVRRTRCHTDVPRHPERCQQPGGGSSWNTPLPIQLAAAAPSALRALPCLNLHHGCFSVTCPGTRRVFARPSQQHRAGTRTWDRWDLFLRATAAPNTAQGKALNERQRQSVLRFCLGVAVGAFGAKYFTGAKVLIHLFLHLYIFISKYGFLTNT